MNQRYRFYCALAASTLLSATSPSQVSAATEREQTIDLKIGWNAVFLEVDPADADPEVVFAGQPIDIVATFFAGRSSGQFMTDPGVDLFKNLGWSVWYHQDRPDAFLSKLGAIYGQRAYLIHATEDHAWSVTGRVSHSEIRWRADDFNFVGFQVGELAAPSFAEFFDSAKGPQTDKIYRLVDGSWRRLENPDATPMRSGEAFWMYAEGACTYQGPLAVETRVRRGLVLADGGTDTLVMRNKGADPLLVTLEHITDASAPVPLSIPVKVVGAPDAPVTTGIVTKPAAGWTQDFTIEAGQSIALPFQARAAELLRGDQTSLIKITTALGTAAWVPVLASRSDLRETD